MNPRNAMMTLGLAAALALAILPLASAQIVYQPHDPRLDQLLSTVCVTGLVDDGNGPTQCVGPRGPDCAGAWSEDEQGRVTASYVVCLP